MMNLWFATFMMQRKQQEDQSKMRRMQEEIRRQQIAKEDGKETEKSSVLVRARKREY